VNDLQCECSYSRTEEQEEEQKIQFIERQSSAFLKYPPAWNAPPRPNSSVLEVTLAQLTFSTLSPRRLLRGLHRSSPKAFATRVFPLPLEPAKSRTTGRLKSEPWLRCVRSVLTMRPVT